MRRVKLALPLLLVGSLAARGCGDRCASFEESCRAGSAIRLVDESTHNVQYSGGEQSPWGTTPFAATLAISIRAQRRVTLTYVRDGRTVIETWRIAGMNLCPL